jgi:hypothetical protein
LIRVERVERDRHDVPVGYREGYDDYRERHEDERRDGLAQQI